MKDLDKMKNYEAWILYRICWLYSICYHRWGGLSLDTSGPSFSGIYNGFKEENIVF